jgi:hypothetical protein
MRIRRFIPHMRVVAFALTGATAGIFVATGMAALAWGYVPPESFRIHGTFMAFTGLLAVFSVLTIDRRKRDRSPDKDSARASDSGPTPA